MRLALFLENSFWPEFLYTFQPSELPQRKVSWSIREDEVKDQHEFLLLLIAKLLMLSYSREDRVSCASQDEQERVKNT